MYIYRFPPQEGPHTSTANGAYSVPEKAVRTLWVNTPEPRVNKHIRIDRSEKQKNKIKNKKKLEPTVLFWTTMPVCLGSISQCLPWYNYHYVLLMRAKTSIIQQQYCFPDNKPTQSENLLPFLCYLYKLG